MKTISALCLALLVAGSAHAQIFRPQAVNRTGMGRDASRNGGESRRDDGGVQTRSHRDRSFDDSRSYYHGRSLAGPWRFDYGHHHVRPRVGYVGGGYFGPRFSYGYVPTFGYYSGYGYGYPYYDNYGYYGSGSAAANGLLLGALAGGIIGHNSGDLRHSAWRGSAWGAGLGWVLGSAVDANRRRVAYESAPVVVQQAAPAQAQPATSQPQQVTIINNYYNASTPMSAANGMFGR
jgi:hypothetical protein